MTLTRTKGKSWSGYSRKKQLASLRAGFYNEKHMTNKQASSEQKKFRTPFGKYFRYLDQIDKGQRYSKEYGSMMILSIMEEVGELSRAYLAKHGRKKTNLAAQADESYEQELGDILLTILRLARVKKINLDERLMYSLKKIERRQTAPKK